MGKRGCEMMRYWYCSEVNLMPQSVPTALKDGTSKEKGKGGKGGQGGKGGEGAEPMEFMALELQAPRPRVSAIGSDSVADVSISTESFGSPPYQRCLSYRLVGGEDCGVSEQVCAALPLAELPASTKHPVKLRKEEGRLFCFLPLPPSAVSLRVAMHVHALEPQLPQLPQQPQLTQPCAANPVQMRFCSAHRLISQMLF
ncbi:unnamed protein product [Durusdinium trenchii]|uniref:Uncharacterized protein n=1 Tax=Durusdinium trenchii TaxID=1381693 RepID=A0ABP0Q645_9DINO